MTDSANVIAISEPNDCGPMSSGSFSAQAHGLEPVHLAISRTTIESQESSCIDNNRGVIVDFEASIDHSVHVGGKHPNAM
jgi:hypothetical protein